MLRRGGWEIITGVSEDRTTFIFMIAVQVQVLALLDHENDGSTILREMSITTYQSIRRNITEYLVLQHHRCKNFSPHAKARSRTNEGPQYSFLPLCLIIRIPETDINPTRVVSFRFRPFLSCTPCIGRKKFIH
jgi:hypothetical protein